MSNKKNSDNKSNKKKNTKEKAGVVGESHSPAFFAVLIVSKINKVRTPAVATAPHALPSSTAPFRHPYYTHK